MLDFASSNSGFLSRLASNSLRARPRKGGRFDSALGIRLCLHGTLRLDFANPSPLQSDPAQCPTATSTDESQSLAVPRGWGSPQDAASKTHGESDFYSAKTSTRVLFLELHRISNGKQLGIHTILRTLVEMDVAVVFVQNPPPEAFLVEFGHRSSHVLLSFSLLSTTLTRASPWLARFQAFVHC